MSSMHQGSAQAHAVNTSCGVTTVIVAPTDASIVKDDKYKELKLIVKSSAPIFVSSWTQAVD